MGNAINPSYISKSGKKTPYIGKYIVEDEQQGYERAAYDLIRLAASLHDVQTLLQTMGATTTCIVVFSNGVTADGVEVVNATGFQFRLRINRIGPQSHRSCAHHDSQYA